MAKTLPFVVQRALKGAVKFIAVPVLAKMGGWFHRQLPDILERHKIPPIAERANFGSETFPLRMTPARLQAVCNECFKPSRIRVPASAIGNPSLDRSDRNVVE
jgi:hypothetical protein